MNTRDLFLVYFARPVGMRGPIKIGISQNPYARCKNGESWSPFPLEIFGTVPGRWLDEQFLHECLAEHHSHGEWFHPSPFVIEAVQSVLGTGGFDRVRATLNPVANVRSKRISDTRNRNRLERSAA